MVFPLGDKAAPASPALSRGLVLGNSALPGRGNSVLLGWAHQPRQDALNARLVALDRRVVGQQPKNGRALDWGDVNSHVMEKGLRDI